MRSLATLKPPCWRYQAGNYTETGKLEELQLFQLSESSQPRHRGSQVAQQSRIGLPMQETQETQVPSLGQEKPLEKEMPTHSRILTWTIPQTEEPGGLQFMASQELDMTW